MKSHDIEASFRMLNQAGVTLSEKISDENGHRHFYLRDPYGNIFEMTEGEDWFHRTAYPGGGVYGAVIGVSDIDRALKLYRDVLGYTEIMSDKTGHFKDLEVLPGGKNEFRRVRIGHGAPGKGGFGQMLGSTELELIQVLNRSPRKIFANRFWGDLGYIHLCFDVIHMDALKLECESHGFPFTVDSANSFDMGEAAGHFSYIEDPDGTLIEFVETHKVPVLKKLRWYIDLRKRNPEKPLPRLMLRALSLNRKKD
jgi:catechol 2,3-dioxygenase-like lactoylglutathione lyase family enzyme